MAVLSVPSNIPTLDGTTAVCVSDDATGTVYLSVRTDRAWYSVANGDSQELADADKAVIIAGTTDANIVFAANQAASLDPEQVIDGLPPRIAPETPYYIGWVQEEAAGYEESFFINTGVWSFVRAGQQSGPDSGELTVIREDNESIHPRADWSGTAYSNTSNLSEGLLLEGARENTIWNNVTVSSLNSASLTILNSDLMHGDLPLAKVTNDTADANIALNKTTNPQFDGSKVSWTAYVKKGNGKPFTLRVYDISIPGEVASYEFDWSGDTVIEDVISGGSVEITQLPNGVNRIDTITTAGVVGPNSQWFFYPVARGLFAEIGDWVHFSPGNMEMDNFTSSFVLNDDGAFKSRSVTSMTATAADLTLVGATNDVTGQVVVRPQFVPTDDRGGTTAIMQLYADSDNHIKLLWAQNTDAISLVKTVAGTPFTATYADSDIGYVKNQRLVIDWACTSSGMSLTVEGFAEQTGTNSAPLATAIVSGRLGSSEAGEHAFQVVESIRVAQ